MSALLRTCTWCLLMAAMAVARADASQPAGASGRVGLKSSLFADGRRLFQAAAAAVPLMSKPRSLLGINPRDLAKGPGIDTRGSKAPYGTCNGCDNDIKGFSKWCGIGGVSGKPSDKKLKYGRQTIYGPYSGGVGWCGKPLQADTVAHVAISTKYLPYKGVSPNSPYCGQCMCIRVRGADLRGNPQPPGGVGDYNGKIFKGEVRDMCPECCADCIDVFGAGPYFNTVPRDMAFAVGVWTAEWQFVDCDVDCDQFFG